MIQYEVIASGSTGNCVIINDSVMIDCGVPYKLVESKLKQVKLVLLTHVHSDHFKPSTLRRMALEKPLLRFGCGSWMVKPLVQSGIAKSQIDVLNMNMLYGYGICQVIPFEVEHDVPNCGYKLFFPNGKVFYATDLGNTAGLSAKNYDLIMLESNYIEEEVKARMDEKRARGEYCYEQRSLRYHLSKAQCDDFVVKNSGPQTEFVYLHCHVDRGNEHESENSSV